jgi:hypothetical protein
MTTPREDAIAALRDNIERLPAVIASGNKAAILDHADSLVADARAIRGAEAETPMPPLETPLDETLAALRAGHWVDLASPEIAEALARADFEEHELHRHGDKWADLPEDRYKQWWRDHAQSVLAAMREAGR